MLFVGSAHGDVVSTTTYETFIKHMVHQHHFQEVALKQIFEQVEIQQPILEAMAKPSEAKPWFVYRQIFMTEARIAAGVEFWQQNKATLSAIEKRTGVPAEIMLAILGVETKYGANTGKYRVMDALATLGFAYPKRSAFFLQELEQYLLLTRDEGLDPLSLKGSYAGAMGYPQFMPSSFRSYASDFDLDRRRDIWGNPADALLSVANYFQHNHWRPGQAIAFQVEVQGNQYQQALLKGTKPNATVGKLRQLGVRVPPQLAASMPARLMRYDMGEQDEYWLIMDNFYVITRYNHSPLYAMAVFQLASAIRERYQSHG